MTKQPVQSRRGALVSIVTALEHDELLAWTAMLITNVLDESVIDDLLQGYDHRVEEEKTP